MRLAPRRLLDAFLFDAFHNEFYLRSLNKKIDSDIASRPYKPLEFIHLITYIVCLAGFLYGVYRFLAGRLYFEGILICLVAILYYGRSEANLRYWVLLNRARPLLVKGLQSDVNTKSIAGGCPPRKGV